MSKDPSVYNREDYSKIEGQYTNDLKKITVIVDAGL